MEKEIIFNWYSNMSEPNKSQLKTLFDIWCLGLFDKTFDLNEDNLYTFLCDYFKFEFIVSGGQDNIWFNNKLGFYITSISIGYTNIHNEKIILNYIRENI